MAHGDDSEAWRGEGEQQPRPANPLAAFFAMAAPRQLTPEEKEKLKDTIAEVRAKAAIRALTLPAYDPERACPKCGGEWDRQAKTIYCRGGTSDDDVINDRCFVDTAGQEHLHRICRRCKFSWVERTIDAPDPVATP